MRFLDIIWLGCFLLPFLLDRSDCSEQPQHAYKIHYRMVQYSNPKSIKIDKQPCDKGQKRSMHCDVRIKWWVHCINCTYHSPPVYYPSENGKYKDASNLSALDFGNTTLTVIVNSRYSQATFYVLITDVDSYSEDEIIALERIDLKELDNLTTGGWEILTRHCTSNRNVKFAIMRRIECVNDDCGSSCVVPGSHPGFLCIRKQLVCNQEYSHPEHCSYFGGTYAWKVKMLRFDTNYTALNIEWGFSCRDRVVTCVYPGFDSCYMPTFAWNDFDKPNISIVGPHSHDYDTYYYGEERLQKNVYFTVILQNSCEGRGFYDIRRAYFGFPLKSSRAFRVIHNNRLIAGVVQSLCRPGFTGWQCSQPCDNCTDADKWTCDDGQTGASCAYKSLCRNNTCLNGGTCLLRRAGSEKDVNHLVSDDEAYRFILNNIDNYTVFCECQSGFSGPNCEEAVTENPVCR